MSDSTHIHTQLKTRLAFCQSASICADCFILPMFDFSVQFATFDILSDEEVRQGLKKFSNWPTYPQLYANGQLIGGLDIVKVRTLCYNTACETLSWYTHQELKEAGELEATLSSTTDHN